MKIGAWYSGDGRCEFTVWAPNSETVSLQILSPEKRLIPMTHRKEEYWQVEATDIQPGDRYLYQLDHETHPDPASFSQPDGVHGPSQVVEHRFHWTDQGWTGVPLGDYIIYELHVGTFTKEGTFEAIIPRLQDLRDLGVNAIEIMPVAQFPGDGTGEGEHAFRNWGYDGVYLFATQNSYGGVNGLKTLVNACHQHGISVILDVVYNHFGPEGNYVCKFGPYFTETYKTPWGNAINFDSAHSFPVRQFFIQNALYWLREFHIDALRLDATQAIYDLGAKHFLLELSENVDALSHEQGRKHYLIAESDLNDARLIRPAELGGYGLDAQWADDFHHALYALLTGASQGYYQDYGSIGDLAKAYRDSFVYDWRYAPHRSRYHGNSARDRAPHQFVVCIQNHDQIGNALPGDRLSKKTSFEGLKLAAGAVILSPYLPMLFMGEEYGEETPFMYFVSHSDPDLIQAVCKGRKEEFAAFHLDMEPPDPEALGTFVDCKLNWETRKEGKHRVLWSFYQHLIRLRNTIPALVKRDRNHIEASGKEDTRFLYWRRWNEDSQVLCLMSFNQQEITAEFPTAGHQWRKILDSADPKWSGPGSKLPEVVNAQEEVTLSPQSFALYEIAS